MNIFKRLLALLRPARRPSEVAPGVPLQLPPGLRITTINPKATPAARSDWAPPSELPKSPRPPAPWREPWPASPTPAATTARQSDGAAEAIAAAALLYALSTSNSAAAEPEPAPAPDISSGGGGDFGGGGAGGDF